MVTTYENEWDWAPAGRNKYNHVLGAVCKFMLNITDSPYTGMLKDGMQTGLIRISLIYSGMGNAYIPSAGVKFLRSGLKSANVVVFPTLNGNTNNIFDPDYIPLSNHVIASSTHEIGDTFGNPGSIFEIANPQNIKKLLQGDDCFSMVGLSDMTRYVYERRKSLKYNLFEFSTNFTIRKQ